MIINKIEDLDFKNSLLNDNLDLDYIETLIRERFLYGNKIKADKNLRFACKSLAKSGNRIPC